MCSHHKFAENQHVAIIVMYFQFIWCISGRCLSHFDLVAVSLWLLSQAVQAQRRLPVSCSRGAQHRRSGELPELWPLRLSVEVNVQRAQKKVRQKAVVSWAFLASKNNRIKPCFFSACIH